MKREEIKAILGDKADDAAIDQIMALHGKDVEKHKTDLASASTERDTFKKSLEDANKQIEDFKKVDPAVIQKTADEWKTKFEVSQAESAAALQKVKFDHALDAALVGAKVKDAVSVKAHLKADALKLNEDGSILGLKEQLEPLQKEKAFLFEPTEETPEIVIGGNNKSINLDAVTEAARTAAGLPSAQGK